MSPSTEEYQVRLNHLENEIKSLKKKEAECEVGLPPEERRSNPYLTALNNQITELRKEKNLIRASANTSAQEGK